MRVAKIVPVDVANGPGARVSIFVAGCRMHCDGCHNEELWSFDAGVSFEVGAKRKLLELLAPDYIDGITILGGEPFEPENVRELFDLVLRIRREMPHKTVWVYTGRMFEDLEILYGPYIGEIDVIVDGPFVKEQADVTLRFRGSRNQRIIDVQKTLGAGRIVEWTDCELFSSHAWPTKED